MPLSLLNKGGTLGPCHDGHCHVGYVRLGWQEECGVRGMIDGAGIGKRTV